MQQHVTKEQNSGFYPEEEKDTLVHWENFK